MISFETQFGAPTAMRSSLFWNHLDWIITRFWFVWITQYFTIFYAMRLITPYITVNWKSYWITKLDWTMNVNSLYTEKIKYNSILFSVYVYQFLLISQYILFSSDTTRVSFERVLTLVLGRFGLSGIGVQVSSRNSRSILKDESTKYTSLQIHTRLVLTYAHTFIYLIPNLVLSRYDTNRPWTSGPVSK